ncbi:MAG: DUF6491 family protein [Pseudoxanthomonas sp.]
MLAAGLLLGACATGNLSDDERLALYRDHAGAPVPAFDMFGGKPDGWTPLGDAALAVWTRPKQGYLVELRGHCQDLDWSEAITLTNQGGRVSARFDKVLVVGGPTNPTRMPCYIDSIRPLDVTALRAAEKHLREAGAAERDSVPAPAPQGS